MSFGFSVSDFITVGDKAWGVYRKCKDAPEQYQQLEQYVGTLCHVLEETRRFIDAGDIPDSEPKIASLASAGHTCRTTLAEVEEFLGKHSRIKSKSKRFIDTIKFISGDVQALRSRLEISTQLLQLSLTSLSSLSVAQIKTNLKDIVREYQSGAHEPTVLSSLIRNGDYGQADGEELHDQLIADLEARDIHPDCITLHDNFIKKWLEDITQDGVLDEIIKPGDTIAHDPSVGAGTINQDISDRASFDAPELSSLTSASPVYPHDQPDSESIQQLLGELLEPDTYSPYRPNDAYIRVQKAYQRLDYTQRGYLTRSEVLKAFQEASEYTGIASEKLDGWNLPMIVAKFDTDQDGRYDLEEFKAVTHQVAQLAFEAKKEQLAETLSQGGIIARNILRQTRQARIKAGARQGGGVLYAGHQEHILPFGWSKNPSGSRLRFHDDVTKKDWPSPPELNNKTFSIMAADAAWCVERIGNLEKKWLTLVPKTLSEPFRKDFDTVRTVALKYILFEKGGHPYELSDLDELMVSCQIIQKLRPGTLPAYVGDAAQNLGLAGRYSFDILSKILAFVQILDESLNSEPTVHRFSEVNSRWRKCQASAASRLIHENSEWWTGNVVQRADQCRQIEISKLRDHAILLAREDALRKTAEIESEGVVREISILGFRFKRKWKILSTRLETIIPIFIELTQVIQTTHSTYISDRWRYSWKPEQNIYLCQGSRIDVKIFYGDLDGRHGGVSEPEWETSFSASERLDLQQLGIHEANGDTIIELPFEESLPTTITNPKRSLKMVIRFVNQAQVRYVAELSILSEIADLSFDG